jgi:hypothetical protein
MPAKDLPGISPRQAKPLIELIIWDFEPALPTALKPQPVWASLSNGGVTEARTRYDAARAMARAFGFDYVPAGELPKRGLTADTALRLGRYFGTAAAFWMNVQVQYDIEVA